ncbi:MAG: hypothetical protein K0U54_09255 [Bacteroidetes bacterium]|nr:hypothetical protein [Bacteroidota bacterium]
MNIAYIALIIVISSVISGCGTFLSISEVTTEKNNPDALVVNRRAIYEAKFSIPDNSPLKEIKNIKTGSKTINGVDHNRLLTLDVKRMPFSSGKLAVTLNDQQLLKEVELTSQTGSKRTIDAANKGFDTRTEIEKARKEAEETTTAE